MDTYLLILSIVWMVAYILTVAACVREDSEHSRWVSELYPSRPPIWTTCVAILALSYIIYRLVA